MTPAERMRRYRERQHQDRRVAFVEIDAALVEDALQRLGYLSRSDADFPPQVDAALSVAVESWCRATIAEALADRLLRVTASPCDRCDTAAMKLRKR